MCAFGGVDEKKVAKLLEVAEEEGVGVVAVQEVWFRMKMEREMAVVLNDSEWRWYGRERRGQKPGSRRGSGGVGFFVHVSVRVVRVGRGQHDGLMWLEVERMGEVSRIVNLYLVPSGSTRHRHNDDVLGEMERLMGQWPERGRVVVGDWNGRVGEIASVVTNEEEEKRGRFVDLGVCRDKTVNEQGKRVLNLMNAWNMVVMNGVMGKMEFT